MGGERFMDEFEAEEIIFNEILQNLKDAGIDPKDCKDCKDIVQVAINYFGCFIFPEMFADIIGDRH